MYTLKDGNFVKNIVDSNENNTYYLLIWCNENTKIIYLIECCEGKVVITNFTKNELYAKFEEPHFKILKYYSAFIYSDNKNGNDYLYYSSSNGYLAVWDLKNKSSNYFKKISKVELYNIIQWNKQYAIVSGGKNKNIIIYDIENLEVFKNIPTEHSSNLNCIKKIIHPLYGECLLSSGNDHKIKLWKI